MIPLDRKSANSNLKRRAGRKNLLINHPRWIECLSKDWDYEENEKKDIRPEEVTAKRNIKAAWKCHECGWSWEALISSRVYGRGCPECYRRRRGTTLLIDNPAWKDHLEAEWCIEKNEKEGIKPDEIVSGSHKAAWWRCTSCNEVWKAEIKGRTKGYGCPYCAKKRRRRPSTPLTDHPAWEERLIAEWDREKNEAEGIYPNEVTAGNTKQRAWWKCKRCGHSWNTSIAHRVKGSICPKCSKRILRGTSIVNHPAWNNGLRDEWDYDQNTEFKPDQLSAGSHRMATWKCRDCGHTWSTEVRNRFLNGTGCPKCASSHGEKDAALWAESQGFVIVEQWRHPGCRDQNPLPFDLMLYVPAGNALMEISPIEYDGEQHSNPDTYFNQMNLRSGRGLDYVQRHDTIKTNFCLITHRILIRVPHTVTGLVDIGAFLEKEFRANGLGWTLAT